MIRYTYLISNLEDREKEIINLRQKAKIFDEEIRSLKSDNNRLMDVKKKNQIIIK